MAGRAAYEHFRELDTVGGECANPPLATSGGRGLRAGSTPRVLEEIERVGSRVSKFQDMPNKSHVEE